MHLPCVVALPFSCRGSVPCSIARDNSKHEAKKLTGQIPLGVGSPPWPEAAHKETAAQTHQRHFILVRAVDLSCPAFERPPGVGELHS